MPGDVQLVTRIHDRAVPRLQLTVRPDTAGQKPAGAEGCEDAKKQAGRKTPHTGTVPGQARECTSIARHLICNYANTRRFTDDNPGCVRAERERSCLMVGSSQWRDPSRSPRAAWIQHTLAPRVLGPVALAFETAQIPILLVKGILTAHILYEDVAARPISDIDLRVSRHHYRAAVRIARLHGWNPETAGPVLWGAMLKVDGWEVDIECTLGPPGLCAISVDDLMRRAERRVEPFGFAHLQPELHDHALVLVLNAFKDGLRVMPWALEDLRRIVRHGDFNDETLVARAREGGVASALWLVSDWLAETHGAPEWRTIRERVGSRPPSARVSRAYGYVRRHGWPPKPGLLVAAGGNDSSVRCASGLALTAAGVLRRRCLLAVRNLRD